MSSFEIEILVLLRSFNIPTSNNYTLLHLDEKWIFNDYIKNYKSIEPKTEEFLINFMASSWFAIIDKLLSL